MILELLIFTAQGEVQMVLTGRLLGGGMESPYMEEQGSTILPELLENLGILYTLEAEAEVEKALPEEPEEAVLAEALDLLLLMEFQTQEEEVVVVLEMVGIV